MNDIKEDIEFYESQKADLEFNHMGKWVLIFDKKVISIYDSFENAAEQAVKLFGRGPYLIRQIGAPPMILPASVMFRKVYHA